MGLQHFNILESKILQTLDLIHRLRNENDLLKSKIEVLQYQLTEMDQEIQDLREQLAQERQKHPDNNFYKKRETEIRSRIEKMLVKLEALEIPL